jgi:hypothetical protein
VKIFAQNAADIFFSGTQRRAILVGNIKMVDAVFKGETENVTLLLERRGVAKVVPGSKTNRRDNQAAVADAIVAITFKAVLRRGPRVIRVRAFIEKFNALCHHILLHNSCYLPPV